MHARTRNPQLIRQHVRTRHRNAEARESAGSRDARDMREIGIRPSRFAENRFDERDKFVVADAVIDDMGCHDRVSRDRCEKAVMRCEVEKQ